jgi:hypothetical protein
MPHPGQRFVGFFEKNAAERQGNWSEMPSVTKGGSLS